MDAAYARLSAQGGWQPISWGGPQRLPPANGSVRAFKFRDPDGHPLELIWFPPQRGRAVWHEATADGPFLGIDHSALAVSSTSRSLAFYRKLGFTPDERSWNHGEPQSALDGLLDARARVIGLRPASPDGAGLELLRYVPPGRPLGVTQPNDLVTDWVTVAVAGLPRPSPAALRDPDGHIMLLENQGRRVPRPGCRREVRRHRMMREGCWMTSLSGRVRGASTISPRPPTRPKFFRNSQKCSNPSLSLNFQNSGNRQNW